MNPTFLTLSIFSMFPFFIVGDYEVRTNASPVALPPIATSGAAVMTQLVEDAAVNSTAE